MRKAAICLGLAAALTLITFLAGVGVIALLLAAQADSFAKKVIEDAAAWFQAIAAAIAIFASAWLALHVQTRSERTARRQAAEVASEVALYASNVMAFTRDQLNSRQGVYNVATRAVYFDLTALDDLWAMMSEISLQEVRSADITRELVILRGTIRQFKQNVTTALQRYAEMNEAEYTTLFRILNEGTNGAAKVHRKIEDFKGRM
ncbi:hypothetical protein D9M68_678420 [compost metagenome]